MYFLKITVEAWVYDKCEVFVSINTGIEAEMMSII